MRSIQCRDRREFKGFQELKVLLVSPVLQAVETTAVSLDTQETTVTPVPREPKEAKASMELKAVPGNVNAVQVEGTRVPLDLLDHLVTQAFQAHLEPKDFRETQEEKATKEHEDHKAFKEFLVQKVSRVRKGTRLVSVLKGQRATLESLDVEVLQEAQAVPDETVPPALSETLDLQELDMQDHVAQKVNQVYQERSAFRGLQVPQVLVFQALRGHLGQKEIRDFLVQQDLLDGKALQATPRSAAAISLVYLV